MIYMGEEMIRENTENLEKLHLSSYAQLSSETRGRIFPETKCTIRTEFQRDRDRIIHCKSFRRLKHKTQVFITPEGDHYRTRLTHTLEVSQIARTIARALNLNEDLTEAIALGHDLGHTPFGHAGEKVLNEIKTDGFRHNEHSLRVVDILENGSGLNLTWETRDGILNHTKEDTPHTAEGQVVNLSDRIAYINHDIDDSIRAGIITKEDLPRECVDVLGREHGIRIHNMVVDVIYNSKDSSYIEMSKEVGMATKKLRNFMFDRVYINSEAKGQEQKAMHIVENLFKYFMKNVDRLPDEYLHFVDVYGKEQVVCDYIAGMTDRYAFKAYENLLNPRRKIE